MCFLVKLHCNKFIILLLGYSAPCLNCSPTLAHRSCAPVSYVRIPPFEGAVSLSSYTSQSPFIFYEHLIHPHMPNFYERSRDKNEICKYLFVLIIKYLEILKKWHLFAVHFFSQRFSDKFSCLLLANFLLSFLAVNWKFIFFLIPYFFLSFLLQRIFFGCAFQIKNTILRDT